MPFPYVLVMYGPCNTWIAWLVTEPELFAIGFAVALTPPTSAAIAVGALTTTLRADRHNAFTG